MPSVVTSVLTTNRTFLPMLFMSGRLAIEFKSYLQPFLVFSMIPFGACGAIFGHVIMGLSFTLFSIYGLVELSGIVVNDSIVLIDLINHRFKDGLSLDEAIFDAGRRRCRPVLLTSLTTVGGMLLILLETPRQAQVLIPMATSLSFGLILGTVLVLMFALVAPVVFFIIAKTQVFVALESVSHESHESAGMAPNSCRGHGTRTDFLSD